MWNFNNPICRFFGHSLNDNDSMLAFNISTDSVGFKVKLYQVSRCKRCGHISLSLMDWYGRGSSWYANSLAHEEEEKLRKEGFVSVAEATKILKEKKEKEEKERLVRRDHPWL